MTKVTLSTGKNFELAGELSILSAAAISKIYLPYSCQTGRCSTCKCKVISGETSVLLAELGLSENEKNEGWILSCARTAASDLTLEVEDLGDVVLSPPKTQACRISSLEKMTSDVIKVVLRLPPGAKFSFIPGQYIDVIGHSGVRRSYSLANAPNKDNTLELHIRRVENGAMSDYWFNQAQINDLLRLNGPQGTFFLRNLAQRELILLATGTGIAPVKAMLEALPSLTAEQMPLSVTVLWGARYAHDLYLDVHDFPSKPKYIPVLSRETNWQGAHGHIQDVLLMYKSNLSNCLVYACGSNGMIQSAKASLISAGLPSQHFFSDAFVYSGTNLL